ncbi:hypothetical protein [Shinella sp.]|uniref:hypothetical protein n=1 Tax=Shinella sp. TaxID=1870904 RepID=UPI004036F743
MDHFTAGDLVTSGTIVWEDTPTHTVYLTRDGDNLRITTHQKVDAILAANANEESDFNYTGRHSDLVKVASLPTSMYFDLQRQGITEDPEAMRRILNDSDNAKFRTNKWRL